MHTETSVEFYPSKRAEAFSAAVGLGVGALVYWALRYESKQIYKSVHATLWTAYKVTPKDLV